MDRVCQPIAAGTGTRLKVETSISKGCGSWGPCPADPRHVVVAASDGRMESVTVEQVVGAVAGRPHLMHQRSRVFIADC